MKEIYTIFETLLTKDGFNITVETSDKNSHYVYISIRDIKKYDNEIILSKYKIPFKEWAACKNYYAYKLDKNFGTETAYFNKPYSMLLVHDTMYKVCDTDYVDNFRELLRTLDPIDIKTEEPVTHNLLKFGDTYGLESFDIGTLVEHGGNFYFEGINLGTIKEVKEKCGKADMSDYMFCVGNHPAIYFINNNYPITSYESFTGGSSMRF